MMSVHFATISRDLYMFQKLHYQDCALQVKHVAEVPRSQPAFASVLGQLCPVTAGSGAEPAPRDLQESPGGCEGEVSPERPAGYQGAAKLSWPDGPVASFGSSTCFSPMLRIALYWHQVVFKAIPLLPAMQFAALEERLKDVTAQKEALSGAQDSYRALRHRLEDAQRAKHEATQALEALLETHAREQASPCRLHTAALDLADSTSAQVRHQVGLSNLRLPSTAFRALLDSTIYHANYQWMINEIPNR
eukprot:scaffold429530_cov53-Prasinocladus_malaysianus.AAC.2